ncbi:hypothetical protein PILCRDRAFT_191417 [Piloderma croceum F 1598]|uniref:Uncharacterized protein n=1 Tax=Piloderma croceum (strain F 1598) TaxID=765440 RepID=A0A0C3GD44_PILCF|nr:hypothetical protein PILCRDRAFT_191417 [Piloderma croceum F 1598]
MYTHPMLVAVCRCDISVWYITVCYISLLQSRGTGWTNVSRLLTYFPCTQSARHLPLLSDQSVFQSAYPYILPIHPFAIHSHLLLHLPCVSKIGFARHLMDFKLKKNCLGLLVASVHIKLDEQVVLVLYGFLA